MVHIRKVRLQTEFPKSIANALSELKGNFTPLIATVKREYWTKLGLTPREPVPAGSSALLAAGELYISKSGDFLYFKLSSDHQSLECGCIQKNGETPDFDSFLDSVKSIVDRELKNRETRWERITPEEKWGAMLSKGASLKPSRAEMAAAKALEDPNLHRLLSRVLSSPSSLLRDVLAQEDRAGAEPVLKSLDELGLLTEEFVVLCKEKGQQIIKVNSREAVEQTSEKGLKCFLCGKPISEESVEKVISVTDLGRKMIEKNYWVSVRLSDMLGKSALGNRAVLDDEEVSTLSTYAFGEIILIALFDRKLSIGDAYLLNAKLSLSQAGVGIVVGLQGVSPLMSEFVAESNPNRQLHFFESMNGLEQKLDEILEHRQQEKIREAIAPFSELTPVSLRDLVCEKIFSQDTETPKPLPTAKRPK